jgi:hypothetical protein
MAAAKAKQKQVRECTTFHCDLCHKQFERDTDYALLCDVCQDGVFRVLRILNENGINHYAKENGSYVREQSKAARNYR